MTRTSTVIPFPRFGRRNAARTAPTPDGEAKLYLRRALRAAAEERHDVALVFCRKALDLSPGDLAARLLLAWLYDRALGDVDQAVAAYRKVITLAGYDAANPYCVAAREALDVLVKDGSR
jgi:tetratricopeptide (TPR) repeat protein